MNLSTAKCIALALVIRSYKMTKTERIEAYNELYPRFNITGIKKMTEDEIESRIQWGGRSLRDVYKRPSDAKLEAYDDLIEQYRPKSILAVHGNSQSFSVLLVAWNGDTLHITKDNNYLVERV